MDKIIKSFNLDLSDLPSAGETRGFAITADNGAEFILEIIDNTTKKYYNFVTNLFQTAKSRLEDAVGTVNYNGQIIFPSITGSDDQYDVYLYAKPGSKHSEYNEVRFNDGSLDLNSSSGSDSLMMQKVIYQYPALTLTVNGYSPNSTVSGTSSSFTTSTDRGKSKPKIPFSFAFTAGATAAYRVLKNPEVVDLLSFVSPVVGSEPLLLPGENEFPNEPSTDTVNGDVTSGITVTMDSAVASKMKVGDRITGNSALRVATVTVTALTGTYTFTMSEAIAIADGTTLSFANRLNYQWPVNNINSIKAGMFVVADTNVTANSVVSKYEDKITLFPGQEEETVIIKNQFQATTATGSPTIVNGVTTVQPGNIVFNNQQAFALAGDTLKIGGYGEDQILNVHGYNVKFTDLKISLTKPVTTTTEATSDHATIEVADREGVINNVSRVSGIGIDATLQNPLITSGGSADGLGDWVMESVQSLENGIELTIENTGRIATISGNIEIVKAGTANATLRFDVEKLLSTSA